MNAIRKILLPFLVIPLGMFVYVFTHPDWPWETPGLESLFAAIGIPILIGNFIAWFYPEIITAYFPVKDSWGGKPVLLAVVISTFVAFTCASVSMASLVIHSSSALKPSPLQPAAATAFARSNGLQSKIGNPSESGVDPSLGKSAPAEILSQQIFQSSATNAAPKQAFQIPVTNIAPEQATETPEAGVVSQSTPQIPVSGGVVSSPTLSPTKTGLAPVSTAATSTAGPSPSPTLASAGACARADPNYAAAILQTVQDADADNEIGTAWAVHSKDASNLWFIATKISGPRVDMGVTLPGVWALYVNSDGSFTIYSINDPATQYSGADWGADADPVLTMQNDGAQASYDCAARAN